VHVHGENVTKLGENYYQLGNNNTYMVIKINKFGRDNQIGFLDAAVDMTIPRYPLAPPPCVLGIYAALALIVLHIVVSWVYMGSPWMVGSDALGKLSIIASGDGSVDVMLDWRARRVSMSAITIVQCCEIKYI
jgi:hypothetical protein